jgi:thymidylate synthase
MATLIRVEDMRGGYLQLVENVLSRGVPQKSRNGDTLEVTDMIIEFASPDKAIPCGIGRRGYSNALAALEGLQLVAGETYDDLMVKVAPNTERFREDDGMFHGGYGRRIGTQMGTIVERLKADHDTRQAVVTIWDPALDAQGGKRDHPCTCLFNWRIRNGRLLMSTFQRSMDIHWGLPYDIVMFCTLQLTMAAYLGVECGPYTHHAASFHAYTKDLPALRGLRPFDGEDLRLQPLLAAGYGSWAEVQTRARYVAAVASGALESPQAGALRAGESWFIDTILKKVRA